MAAAVAWGLGDRPQVVPLLVAIAAAIVSSPFRIPLPVLGNVSIAFAFVFASLIMLGGPAAVLTAAVSGVSASLLKRGPRPPVHRVLFNVADLSVSAAVAAGVFRLAGGTPGPLDPAAEWLAVVIGAAAFFMANSLLVAGAVSLTDEIPFFHNWRTNFLWTGPAYLAGAFLGAALVMGVQRFGLPALGLSLPLLYVLYFSLSLYAEKMREERRHAKQVADLYLSVIEALALAIDAKDRTTQRHIRRVQAYAVELGRILKIPDAGLEALKAGALLHDVGKLAVPEHILCKPGPLTPEETEKMRIHPRIGVEILETINFPFPLTEVVRSHHEKWDGTGYPDRLKGEEIPITARILSVADCYDALTSDRPYRKPLGREEALKYVQDESGTSFDPKVVEALVDNLDRLHALADEINLSQETASAPDKRKLSKGADPLTRDTNLLRTSILEHIYSAQGELFALYEIAQSTARSLNLDEAMGFIAGKIARLLHYRCLVLYLHDKERKVLSARVVHGLHSPRLSRHTLPLGSRMSGWAAVHRMPLRGVGHQDSVRREGARSDLEDLMQEKGLENLDSSIVAPLLDGDELLGVLALYDVRDFPYEDDHLRIISTVAKHVATAVKNALQFGAREENALVDPLTRLPNARYLFVSFEEELARATRQQVPLSIIELDVNNFNEVNDQHGHAAGDRILRQLARVIRKQMRGCDTCVRYAADEFIVTLPGVGKPEVARLQGRIQETIEAHKFVVHGGKPVKLSVSMGTASFPEDGKSLDALIAVADARMYDVKTALRKGKPDGSGYQRFTGRRSVGLN
ncbi:MAG TPA: HD domain-containing phosphohydrolase [Candidatus Polarisedimenticolia bacterium]|nr:HD domain-containing phosphohydrolase [Candidatus Polarisedimenticolia bacterium]